MTIKSFKELKRNLKSNILALPSIKVALLGDSATQFLAIALKGTAIERGFNIELFEADFNQIELQLFDKDSELYKFKADFVIVFQSTHKILSNYNSRNYDLQFNLAEDRIELVKLMCESISSKLIYFNYPEIDDSVFGSFSNKIEHSFIFQIRKLNFELMKLSQNFSHLFICDIASIQNQLGRNFIFDPSIYVNTEMLFSIDSISYVAYRTIDIISAILGKFKKCLILDLDNTIWGGVIGDDGLENIQIGHSLGIGKVYSEFQEWVLKLKNRGIIIAVCSKNNEEIAKEPFLKHPEMKLHLNDIAVFVANWDSKVDNIRKIQSILNIGFDSMVFLDDNPFERNIVRQNIPEIEVPELPVDPGEYLEYLYSLNLFETASFSIADSHRTQQYQIESQRLSMQMSCTDETHFLKSLHMVSEINSFDHFNIPRVSQLSQRSNQFNLRTIRYTENEIELLSSDPQYMNFCFTLSDKFGDHGLICVVILQKINEKVLFVNTWLMSCRVLKRGMENFTLNTIVKYAQTNGFETIRGEYIPTLKNKMVEDHYEKLGFLTIESKNDKLYELNVSNYIDKECLINIK